MAYNASLPADSSIIAQGPGEIRENFRALKDDRIVDAGTLGGNAASAFLLKSGGVMTGAAGIIAGTAAAPGLYFSGDTNTGVFAPAADTLALSTGGTEQLRITSAGRFGLGVTSPDYPLQYNTRFAVETSGIVRWGNNISSASPANYGMLSWDVGRALVMAGESCHLDFYVNATSQIMRLTTTGRVLIGTTTDDGENKLQVAGAIISNLPGGAITKEMNGTPAVQTYRRGFCSELFNSANFYHGFHGKKARGTKASPAAVAQNDILFSISGTGFDGSYNRLACVIAGQVDSISTGASVSGRLSFYTGTVTGDVDLGASTGLTERMRLTAAGNLLIGSTTDDGSNKLQLTGNAKITGNLEATGKTIISAGTAAAPALYFTGDTNTGIFAPAADTLGLSTGGSERLRVNSAGRVLIGTTTDDGANLLQVNGNAKITGNLEATGKTIISAGTAAAPALYFTGDTNTGLFAPAADTLALATAGAERLRINSAGRILIGTTTDDGTNLLQVNGFTKLGDAATGVKMKLLTGTTPSDPSGVASVSHGLDVTKIIGATVFVTGGANSKYPPAYNAPGYKYSFGIGSANFSVSLESATALTSSAITIMVWYIA